MRCVLPNRAKYGNEKKPAIVASAYQTVNYRLKRIARSRAVTPLRHAIRNTTVASGRGTGNASRLANPGRHSAADSVWEMWLECACRAPLPVGAEVDGGRGPSTFAS